MNEDFLHYIWKFGLFDKVNLLSTAGQSIEIIKQGEHNKDSGPDFFNAKVKIDGTLWAGNVEIHINSSDWMKHNHQHDEAYNNVILHVVLTHDEEVYQRPNEAIPTLELKFRILPNVKQNYENLKRSNKNIPCANLLKDVKEITSNNWLQRMAIERLESKTEFVKQLFEETNHDWQETFYRLLANNFGFKTNSEPFLLLAKKLPLNIIFKHKNDLFQLESLLFGIAGFLDQTFEEEYPRKLQNEFEFLRKKYQMFPIKSESWKYMRMRPLNFPTLRIAQFAMLLHNSSHLFSKVLEENNLANITNMFKHNCSEYWDTHYSFSSKSEMQKKQIGESAIELLLINSVAPLLFFYGKTKGEQKYTDRAIEFLTLLKPESNKTVKEFTSHKLIVQNACDTQGLIHLEKEYCRKFKCLKCAIGNELLKK